MDGLYGFSTRIVASAVQKPCQLYRLPYFHNVKWSTIANLNREQCHTERQHGWQFNHSPEQFVSTGHRFRIIVDHNVTGRVATVRNIRVTSDGIAQRRHADRSGISFTFQHHHQSSDDNKYQAPELQESCKDYTYRMVAVTKWKLCFSAMFQCAYNFSVNATLRSQMLYIVVR